MSNADASLPLVRAARAVGVRDTRVLEALSRVDRSAFVPSASAHLADVDRPLPIDHSLVTTQPSLVAQMIEALELSGGERVLEIGTGYGYQTAILAQLAENVYSIERFADLAERASRNLERAGIRNAFVVTGDGTRGLAAHAPYDAIVVAAAAPQVPPALGEQLHEGGRLVQPIGPGGSERVTKFRKQNGRLRAEHTVTAAYFVPLIHESELP